DAAKTAFDGTYLLIHSDTDREGGDLYELVTFDPEKKVYRMWTYTPQGSIYVWEGAWDAKAHTITFTGDLPSGLTGLMRGGLASDDKIGQELVVKPGPFPAFPSTGTLTRKPK